MRSSSWALLCSAIVATVFASALSAGPAANRLDRFPSLQNVTDIGATSTNSLTVGGLTLSTPVWDDMRVTALDLGLPGISDPNFTTWQPGGSGVSFGVYGFQKNDVADAIIQIPHGYSAGTDLKPHIHWTARDRGNEEAAATVGWKVDYSICNDGAACVASQQISLSDTVTGTDHIHEMTSMGTISGTNVTRSAIIVVRISRTDTGADDTWAGTTDAQLPALLEFDVHYQVATLGGGGPY